MEAFCKKVSTFYPHVHIYQRTDHLNFPPLCGSSHEIHLKISSFCVILDLKAAAPPSPCYYSQELETEIKYGLTSPM